MATHEDNQKRVEQAEYRAKLIEAELNAVKSSRAYQLSRKLGIIKAQIKSDPVGLSKKAARILLTNPKKARHLLRSVNRGALITQSVAEQNAKYQEWILLNEPDESELDEQRKASEKFAKKPVISLVTPVFNPPAIVLEELIESVLEQTYPHFELCLGDFGDSQEVQEMLERYAKADNRVKYYKFTSNDGIAGNSNQVLTKATGEFIGLLDHDDTISPDALYENVKLLNEKPYDFIYSDKDKIDEAGNRFDPLFKPEPSPEMLLNINYLTHLNIMRTSIVRKIGGWDPVTDGAQDWDIFLRVIDASRHIGHIPKVLYHWRVIASSTAMSIETKPYALANQCKAIDKHLKEKNIPARAYVNRTELFLRWDKKALDSKPILFLSYSNLTNTLRAIRRVRKAVADSHFVVLVKKVDSAQADMIASQTGADVLTYGETDLTKVLGRYLGKLPKKFDNHIAIFMRDTILLPRHDEWYENLTGWLSIQDVAAASGRLVDRHDLIVNSGAVVTPDGTYFPLFHKYPRYYQSYIGNAEWIRNLTMLSPAFCATKIALLKEFDFAAQRETEHTFDGYFLWLSKRYRLVLSPHATASVYEDDGSERVRALPKHLKAGKCVDPFSNPNMSAGDPLRLFEDEALPGIVRDQASEPVDRYQYDATILSDTFDITESELAANHAALSVTQTEPPRSVAWFLPAFDAVYAGLVNIFSFANYLAEQQDLKTTFYILKAGGNVDTERDAVVAIFPALKSAAFVALTPAELPKIKPHDMGIATQWASAYPLARTNAMKRKYYFIQDNEANFYPKGSISALVSLSYTFGFTAIAGTEGLLDMYRKQYGGDGMVLKSKVDLSAYHPRKEVHYTPKKPYKVFFYARPNMPRNAFELGIAGLKQLKQQLGNDVEIITAGAPWDVAAYGVEGMFTNLGKIAYEAVPKLYRTVDAGLMFMFSGHPGVTASELMASGCPVVVNEYDDVTWHELYQHEQTCLITLPTASEIARNLTRCLQDNTLRKKLIDRGLAKVKDFYDGYEDSLIQTFAAIKKG